MDRPPSPFSPAALRAPCPSCTAQRARAGTHHADECPRFLVLTTGPKYRRIPGTELRGQS